MPSTFIQEDDDDDDDDDDNVTKEKKRPTRKDTSNKTATASQVEPERSM